MRSRIRNERKPPRARPWCRGAALMVMGVPGAYITGDAWCGLTSRDFGVFSLALDFVF